MQKNFVAAVVAVFSILGSAGHACSRHGTNAGGIDWLSTGVNNGTAQGFILLDTSLVAPTNPTTCAAGIGLGSTGNLAPDGLAVTDMSIVVLNRAAGSRVPLPAFSFTSNRVTSAGLAAGSGASAPPNTNPLFADSTWFGFSADVEPFVQPPLERDESYAFQFAVELPASLLPLQLDAQFAGGEGQSDGTPIFDGSHSVQYFSAQDPSISIPIPEPNTLVLTSVVCWILAIRRSRFTLEGGAAKGRCPAEFGNVLP